MPDFIMTQTTSEFQEILDNAAVDIQAAALSVGCAYDQIIYSTDTTTVLDDVEYFFDATTQIIYVKPDDIAAGQYIVSFDAGLLTITNSSDYTLISVVDRDRNEHEYRGIQDSAVTGLDRSGSMIVIGDSISNGQGASTYTDSYLYKFMRCLNNKFLGKSSDDSTFGYETLISMSRALNLDGVSTTGSIVVDGCVDSRLLLEDGEYIEVTRRSMQVLDAFYNGEGTTGSAVFSFGGITYATKDLSGNSGVNHTFPTYIFNGNNTSPDDVIRITASGGDLLLTGLITYKKATTSPRLFTATRSGWGFDDFRNGTRVQEISDIANTFKTSGGVTTLFVALGTNNMFVPALAKTPADYVDSLDLLIEAYKVEITGLIPIIQVPLRANESVYPLTFATYDEYVNAIVSYAEEKGCLCLRLDQVKIPEGGLPDGIHPNNLVHGLVNNSLCELFGISNNYSEMYNDESTCEYRSGSISYGDLYGDYAGQSKFKARVHREGNVCHLSGLVASNGSTSLQVGTIPIGYRPDVDQYYNARSNGGMDTVKMKIASAGAITIENIPTAYISFQNISFIINTLL